MAAEKTEKLSISDMASFCKRTGMIFQNSEIYGGFSGFWDYGPRGAEIKNNIKQSWWNTFVRSRDDVFGMDGTTITHPSVWVASGHVDSFSDPLVDCKKCRSRLRADHIVEDTLKISVNGMGLDALDASIKENKIKCPLCGGDLTDARAYNLMFKTNVGPIDDEKSIAYMRPETAQLMFANFRLIADGMRARLPFGIAQMGRAYRNEISPRDFLFRSREFEQMEIEYFIRPDTIEDCKLLTKEMLKQKALFLSAPAQDEKGEKHAKMTFGEALKEKIIVNPHLAYWLILEYNWFTGLGIRPENLRMRQHKKSELAHYAVGCIDIEYNFPFGWKEIYGLADRNTFDLDQHIKNSKKDLSLFDEELKKRVVPRVAAEPSQGVDRAFLAFMFDAYDKPEADHTILHLHAKLAPVKVAVFPLMKKDGLGEMAQKIHESLKENIVSFYDAAGSIGKRYYRMDEVGTPLCVTVDYDSLKKDDVTLRERDTGNQIRVKVSKLEGAIKNILAGKAKLEDFGDFIN